MQNYSQYNPPAGVTEHYGEPLPQNLNFFLSPPAQIGEIKSAYSTLTVGNEPRSTASRATTAAAIVLGFVLVIFVAASLLGFLDIAPMFAVFFALIAGPVAFLVLKTDGRCSYVGREGVAQYRWSPDAVQRGKSEIFLFASAMELRTGETRHYYNGAYTGTDYHFTWTDTNSKVAYKLSGRHYGEKKPPPPKDNYRFATAAEIAWTEYLLARAIPVLEHSGSIRFSLAGGDYIAIGQGFLDLHIKGKDVHCESRDLARIAVHQGQFTVRRVDAKSGFLGIGSSGVFTFPYSSVANARLFLALVNTLVYGSE